MYKTKYNFKQALIYFLLIISIISCEKESDSLPVIVTTEVSEITATSAKSGGNILDDAGSSVIARGVCWSKQPSPTINDNKTIDGAGGGSYTSILDNLEPASTYFIRAYASNSNGTSYGLSYTFSTDDALIEITTSSFKKINITTVEVGVKISSSGGAEIIDRGVCWSNSINPTISNNKSSSGQGVGDYVSTIDNLNIGQTYYIRPYATNLLGTTYGDEIEYDNAQNIWEVIKEDDRLSNLVSMFELTHNEDKLLTDNLNITLFAPSNNAINSLFNYLDVTDYKLIREDVLIEMLNYLIVDNILSYEELNGAIISSQGEEINVVTSSMGKELQTGLNGNAGFIETDINASNGIIHIIDEFIIPETILSNFIKYRESTAFTIKYFKYFTILAEAIEKADNNKDLESTIFEMLFSLESVTLFATVNDVFVAAQITVNTFSAAQWDAIIRGHIVQSKLYPLSPGNFMTVNGSFLTIGNNTVQGTANANPTPIVAVGIVSPNGVIYPIGGVLIHN